MTHRNYIVTAPSYNPNNGGGIFQHQLVHALNSLGETAVLWPQPPLPVSWRIRLSSFRRAPLQYWKKPPFHVNPDLNTPVGTRADLTADSIVVYPEIVLGNPLRARHVARWLLYKPGLLHPYEFGPKELFFKAGEMSDLPEVTGGARDLFLWTINPAYRNENRPDRKGACFIVRKGTDKPRIPETADAIQVDGLSHEDMAEVFNQCETFYSYDEATFYSQYAAMCGCVSVIVPGLFANRADWVAQHDLGRVGVAYGLDDLDHARETGHLVEGVLRARQAEGLESVKHFVETTKAQFWSPSETA